MLGGNGYAETDSDVFKSQRMLALKEGIFCEPAGAVALDGLAKAVEKKEVLPGDKMVCLITGSGFKDMQSVDRYFGLPETKSIDSELLNEIIQNIKLNKVF